MMQSKNPKKRQYKPGSVKRDEKNKQKLNEVAKDPKQKKLSFGSPVSGSTTSSCDVGPENVPQMAITPNEATLADVQPSTSAAFTVTGHQECSDPCPQKCGDESSKPSSTSFSSPETEIQPSLMDVEENQDYTGDQSAVGAEAEQDHDHENLSGADADNNSICLGEPTMGLDNKSVSFVAPREDSPLYVKKAFLTCHPVQPLPSPTEKLLFDPSRVYFKKIKSAQDEPIKREWLSYCKSNSSLYCSTCMTFSSRSESNFITGFNVLGRKDVYDKIAQHENSRAHIDASSALISVLADKDIGSLIDVDLRNEKLKQRDVRLAVVERIVDICIFIGRQGIAYRATEEAAYSLDNRSKNHGNFLELVMLLADYDEVLKQHVNFCIKKSKKQRESSTAKQQRGRGSFVSFLSKTTDNKLIRIIGSEIQDSILKEVKSSRIFSLQVDSTQDVGVLDQLAIVVRYVDSLVGVKERLLRLVVSHDNTGEGLFKLVQREMNRMELDLTRSQDRAD